MMNDNSGFDGDDNGLPPEWDPNLIPDGDDLARAALEALHREVSFVLLHRDQPQMITDRLGRMDEMVRAALAVRGNYNAHLPEAIRFALALDWPYWMASQRFQAWQNTILMMLSTVRELKDQQLQSRIFRAWGVFLLLSNKYDGARVALDGAIKDLEGLDRNDLRLLMRAERFNIAVEHETLDTLHAQAAELLVEANRLNFRYIKGRVYLSLARAYWRAHEFPPMFMYAQQAVVYFMAESDRGLAMQSLSMMALAHRMLRGNSSDITLRLMAYTERMMGDDRNPWYWSRIYHEYSVQYFYRARYDQSVTYALRAQENYAAVNDELGVARMQHQMGLIRTKQKAWQLAENHFARAAELYRELDSHYEMVSVDHALGWNWYEQGMLPEALTSLEQTLEFALVHSPDDGLWRRLIDILREDIATVKAAMTATAD
jgi:tetratricopeptide (TPR) repeat protein